MSDVCNTGTLNVHVRWNGSDPEGNGSDLFWNPIAENCEHLPTFTLCLKHVNQTVQFVTETREPSTSVKK
jgi:hypothetical protein